MTAIPTATEAPATASYSIPDSLNPSIPPTPLPRLSRSTLYDKLTPEFRATLDQALIDRLPAKYRHVYKYFGLGTFEISYTAFYEYARRVRMLASKMERDANHDPSDPPSEPLVRDLLSHHLADVLSDPEPDLDQATRLMSLFHRARRLEQIDRRLDQSQRRHDSDLAWRHDRIKRADARDAERRHEKELRTHRSPAPTNVQAADSNPKSKIENPKSAELTPSHFQGEGGGGVDSGAQTSPHEIARDRAVPPEESVTAPSPTSHIPHPTSPDPDISPSPPLPGSRSVFSGLFAPDGPDAPFGRRPDGRPWTEAEYTYVAQCRAARAYGWKQPPIPEGVNPDDFTPQALARAAAYVHQRFGDAPIGTFYPDGPDAPYGRWYDGRPFATDEEAHAELTRVLKQAMKYVYGVDMEAALDEPPAAQESESIDSLKVGERAQHTPSPFEGEGGGGVEATSGPSPSERLHDPRDRVPRASDIPHQPSDIDEEAARRYRERQAREEFNPRPMNPWVNF